MKNPLINPKGLLGGIKNIGQFFKIIETLIKINRKALLNEGIEAKVTRIKMDDKVWRAILIREIGDK